MKQFIPQILLVIFASGLIFSCATNPAKPGQQGAVASPAPDKVTIPVIVKKEVVKQVTVDIPRVIREEVTFADGTLNQYTTYAYDKQARLVAEDVFNQKKQLTSRKKYEFSADGLVQTITTLNPSNEVQGIASQIMDAQGMLIKETLLNAKKEVQSISEYNWNQDGTPLVWLSRNRDQSIFITTNYKSRSGKVHAIELLDSQNKLIKRFEHTWNSQGQLVKKVEIDPDLGPLIVVNYSYENNLLAREEYVKNDGSTIRSIVYRYDERKLPVQIQYLDRRGKLAEIRKQDFQIFSRVDTVTVLE